MRSVIATGRARREVGRDGTVEVQVDPASGRVMIGGHCVSCIAGRVVVGH